MIKKKTKNLFLYFATFLLAVSSFFAVGSIFAQGANTDELTFNGTIKEAYAVGETFEVPEAKFGDEVADFVVYLPDGTATYASSFVLKQSGEHIIEYLLLKNDDVISKTVTFNVLTPMFSIAGEGYTEFKALPNGTKGVYANLDKNATLQYNGVIDLTKIAASDPLFRFMCLPAVIGEADTNGLEVKLTDAYDENLTLTIRFKKYIDGDSNDYTISYLDCAFNDSDYIGLQEKNDGKIVYNGTNYTYTKNHEKFGATFTMSMTGGTANSPRYMCSGITFDETTGLVSIEQDAGGRDYSVLVSDVSNINLYGKIFSGFTDGKVKLSMKPFNAVKNNCGLFFSEICGESVTETSYKAFSSNMVPEIDIDFGENGNVAPQAKQGRAYKIFNATAHDVIDGELDVKTEVYFGYETKNKVRVNVSDNAFTANRVGEYTIVYTATNSSGVTARTLVRVQSVQAFDEIELIVENEIDYDAPQSVGERIKLFDGYSVTNSFGAAGLRVSIALKGNEAIVYHLDDDFSFEPLYAGEYEVVYSFNDYIDVSQITRELSVESDEVVCYDLVKPFHKYFIRNGKYDVNTVKAYSLESGAPVEVPVKVYFATNDSASETEINGLLTVDGSEKVTLIYRPQVGFNVEPYTVDIPVVDTGYGTGNLDKSKYFVPTEGNVAFRTESDSVVCEFVQPNDGVISFDFANVLARNKFSLSLESYLIDGVFNPFGRLNLYLEDCLNASNVVKFSLYRENGIWLACVNDGSPLKFKDSWGLAGDLLNFDFNVYGGVFKLNNELTFDVRYFYETETSVVFENGLNLNVEFVDVGDCGGMKIKSINGQTFNRDNVDFGEAMVDLAHYTHAGYKALNSVIEVGGFYAFDVLSPNTEVYLTVRGPKGIIKSNGVSLNKVDAKEFYEFTLSEYGMYSVTVLVSDGINERSRPCGNIIVEDNTPPKVTVTAQPNSGKVNKTVKLATFTVNLAEGEYDYFFAIFAPNEQVTYTTEKSFVPTVAGEYEIHLFVFDTSYNLTELVYTIVVK